MARHHKGIFLRYPACQLESDISFLLYLIMYSRLNNVRIRSKVRREVINISSFLLMGR
jgi:hypothetical protein